MSDLHGMPERVDKWILKRLMASLGSCSCRSRDTTSSSLPWDIVCQVILWIKKWKMWVNIWKLSKVERNKLQIYLVSRNFFADFSSASRAFSLKKCPWIPTTQWARTQREREKEDTNKLWLKIWTNKGMSMCYQINHVQHSLSQSL